MSAQPAAVQREERLLRGCERRRCVDDAHTLHLIRVALGATLPAGGDPVAAVEKVMRHGARLQRERNAVAAAVSRAHELWVASRASSGVVLADDLGAALYIGEDELQ